MTSIPLNNKTQRFYQGVATAKRVQDEHADVEWPSHEVKVAMFWFYVGALAAGEHGCATQEDFDGFVLGANTRTPHATWPTSDTERETFQSWQYEVANGDTTLGFRAWAESKEG